MFRKKAGELVAGAYSMLRKKCDQCKKEGWFWESGWYYETMAEAEQREARNPYMMQSKARLLSMGTDWKTRRELFCPECISKERGYIPATKPCPCCKCGKTVAPKVSPRLAWYDAEQAGWYCSACKAVSCGTCATAMVQKLKAKYGAAGATLKRAIDADSMAIYETREVSPRCPQCSQQPMLMYGEVSS